MFSTLQLSSGILGKKAETLDLGYPTRPDVQTLKFENQTGEIDISIPWVHSGPMAGLGGGRLSTDVIEDLNQKVKVSSCTFLQLINLTL